MYKKENKEKMMDVNIIGAIKCYLTRSEDPNLQRSHADNLRRSVSTEGQTDFRSVAFHRGSLQTASLSTEEFFKFEHATEYLPPFPTSPLGQSGS